MFKLNNLFKFVAVLALFAVVGCQDRSNLVEPQVEFNSELSGLALPGVTLDSAVFSIYVGVASDQTVRAHRITADWTENTVSWNNFAGAFDPTVIGSFSTASAGFQSIDVTSLVQAWIDGVYPNYGILIEQGPNPMTVYLSSEWVTPDFRPMLKICYTTIAGSECVTIQRGLAGTVNDSYIWEIYPYDNHGTGDRLWTGLVNDSEKQSLLRFSLPEFPEFAAIGDFVWHDVNMNGIQDAGEMGVPGVTVNLYDCAGAFVATMPTDANGYYLFSGLIPGDYFVEFVLPVGFFFSPQDQGANDAADSDANTTTGRTICTNLIAGETDLTWDAGIYRETPPPPGCTRTIGYWKTHAGFGPQEDVVTALLPVNLGTSGGVKTLNVTTALIAYNVLSQDTYGRSSNGITKLYAQLLGAKLNGENGADLTEVAAAIAAADIFLATHDHTDWRGLSDADKAMVLGWQGTLDDYNNGLIGPIHCD